MTQAPLGIVHLLSAKASEHGDDGAGPEALRASSDIVTCSSGPSGQAVSLAGGVGARYEGQPGSVDNGGPSMPMGTSFHTASGEISCDSSTRGISCTDGQGHGFTIGDHYLIVRSPSGERRY